VGPEPATLWPASLCDPMRQRCIDRTRRQSRDRKQAAEHFHIARAPESSPVPGVVGAAQLCCQQVDLLRTLGKKGKHLGGLAVVKADVGLYQPEAPRGRVAAAGEIVAIVAAPPGKVRRTKQAQ